MVIASGNQTSKPASRYFFTKIPEKARLRRLALEEPLPPDGPLSPPRWWWWWWARWTTQAPWWIRSWGVGLGSVGLCTVARAAVGLGHDGRVARDGLGLGVGIAVAKIGDVPARSLELEAGRRQLLLEGFGMARRADGEKRIGDLLQHIFRVAARLTAVCVDRHG